jgi:hypothetical protein
MEAQPSMTGYVRELVRRDKHERDMHDERLDFAALKASELQAENARLRELVQNMMRFFEDGDYCTACEKAAECDAQEEYDDDCLMRGVFHARMRELGAEVDG